MQKGITFMNDNISFELLMDMFRGFSAPLDQGVVLFGEEDSYANEKAISLLNAETEREAVEMIAGKFPGYRESGRTGRNIQTAFIETGDSASGESKLLGLELHRLGMGSSAEYNYVLFRDFSFWSNQDEMRKEFISSISHRLRTPITSIHHALEVVNVRGGSTSEEDRTRFIELGLRNTHKLISLVDELQKLYMVQSEEMNGTRGLCRPGSGIYSCFCRLERNGIISGFDLESCDCAVFTQFSRLETFTVNVVDLFRKWLDETPYLRVRIRCERHEKDRQRIVISIGCCGEEERDIRDFLYYSESHRSLILERLVTALEGTMTVGPGAELTVSIPECPSFNREKDLIYPLNSITEEARVNNSCFCLVHLGLADSGSNRGRVLRDLLGESLTAESHPFISIAEEEDSYLLFFESLSGAETEDWVEEFNERFIERLGTEGISYGGGLRWDFKLKKIANRGEAAPLEIDLV